MNATRAGILVSLVGALGALAGCMGPQAPGAVAVAPAYASSEGGAARGAPSSVGRAEPSAVEREAPQPGVAAGKDKKAPEQLGLGTEWGETRRSEIEMVSFARADERTPSATDSLFYNDVEGARALDRDGLRNASRTMFDVARGALRVGLRDEGGAEFPVFVSGDRNVVVGQAGHRYTIVLHNNTSRRVEVLVSVDGLDVLDGKPASFEKRGYVVPGRGDVEIDGFRQSLDEVAAFRFGSVRGSYAGQKYGDTRNVGVIGVAAFEEKGSLPLRWTAEEVRRRRAANPFPGEFATPPGD